MSSDTLWMALSLLALALFWLYSDWRVERCSPSLSFHTKSGALPKILLVILFAVICLRTGLISIKGL